MLTITSHRTNTGKVAVVASLPYAGRSVLLTESACVGTKRALYEAQRDPAIAKRIARLKVDEQRARDEFLAAEADREAEAARKYGDDDLLRAAMELGIDLEGVRWEQERDHDLLLGDGPLSIGASL